MNEKLENKIFKKFKKIFPKKAQWGIECDDGWYELIYNLCEKLQEYVDESECEQVVAVQVKEKFGSLRFYIANNIGPLDGEEHSDFIFDMIQEAEKQSLKICEVTGGKGVLSKRGLWVKTVGKEAGFLLGYEPCKKSDVNQILFS